MVFCSGWARGLRCEGRCWHVPLWIDMAGFEWALEFLTFVRARSLGRVIDVAECTSLMLHINIYVIYVGFMMKNDRN